MARGAGRSNTYSGEGFTPSDPLMLNSLQSILKEQVDAIMDFKFVNKGVSRNLEELVKATTKITSSPQATRDVMNRTSNLFDIAIKKGMSNAFEPLAKILNTAVQANIAAMGKQTYSPTGTRSGASDTAKIIKEQMSATKQNKLVTTPQGRLATINNILGGGGGNGGGSPSSFGNEGGGKGFLTTMTKAFTGVKGKDFKKLFRALTVVTGAVSKIWDLFEKASPFLSGIMDIITQLFLLMLMPIGNAIAQGMLKTLPALVDFVLDFINDFENSGLKDFFVDTGEKLGELVLKIFEIAGDLIKHLPWIIDTMIMVGDFALDVIKFLIKNWPLILVAIGAIAVALAVAFIMVISSLLTTATATAASAFALAVIAGLLMSILLLLAVYTGINVPLLILNTAATVALATPILLILGVILLIIAAIYILWNYFDKIVEFFTNIWNTIKNIASIIWEALKRGFQWLIDDLPRLVWEGIKGIGQGIVDVAVGVVDFLNPFNIGSGKFLGMFASGAHVPSTPGGGIALLGEGGEGEWVIPDSKIDQFVSEAGGRGGVYVTIQGNVIGMDNFRRVIEDAVDRKNNASRFR